MSFCCIVVSSQSDIVCVGGGAWASAPTAKSAFRECKQTQSEFHFQIVDWAHSEVKNVIAWKDFKKAATIPCCGSPVSYSIQFEACFNDLIPKWYTFV